MRRRAVLVVEYTVTRFDRIGPVLPDAERWEQVFDGAGIANLRVDVQEDGCVIKSR